MKEKEGSTEAGEREKRMPGEMPRLSADSSLFNLHGKERRVLFQENNKVPP